MLQFTRNLGQIFVLKNVRLLKKLVKLSGLEIQDVCTIV